MVHAFSQTTVPFSLPPLPSCWHSNWLFSFIRAVSVLFFTIVHWDYCCDFLLMHKIEESVLENAPLIPVILLKDTQVWAKLSEKMTESCMLLSGIASSSVAQFSKTGPKPTCSLAFRLVKKWAELKEWMRL